MFWRRAAPSSLLLRIIDKDKDKSGILDLSMSVKKPHLAVVNDTIIPLLTARLHHMNTSCASSIMNTHPKYYCFPA